MRIESLAAVLPPTSVSTENVLAGCRRPPSVPLERLTGISRRGVAGSGTYSIDLAENAARACLRQSRYHPRNVDAVVCCNISRCDGPGFHFVIEPGTAIRLVGRLGLRPRLCFDVSSACAGVFTGLRAVQALLDAGAIRTALVVSGEYITHLTETAQREIRTGRDPRLASLTLGDAGAAILVDGLSSDNTGFMSLELHTLGAYSDLCIGRVTTDPAGGAVMLTDSGPLHEIAIGASASLVSEHLDRSGWMRTDIQHFVMHQTADRAIRECAGQINDLRRAPVLDRKNVIVNLRNRGNTATTSHPLALWDALMAGRIQPEDNVLFAVQASGITVGAAQCGLGSWPARVREPASAPESERTVRLAGPAPGRWTACTPNPGSPGTRVSAAVRVGAEALGGSEASAVDLASAAARRCQDAAGGDLDGIGLIIYTGVHRDDFLCEPAMAALVQGRLGIRATTSTHRRALAFDICNGSLGTLQALQVADAMIRDGAAQKALIVSAEIDNNAGHPGRPGRGWHVGGSAILVEATTDDDGRGFLAFGYAADTEFVATFESWIGQDRGISYLETRGDDLPPSRARALLEDLGRDVLDTARVDGMEIGVLGLPSGDPGRSSSIASALGLRSHAVLDPPGPDLATARMAEFLRRGILGSSGGPGRIGLLLERATGAQAGACLYRF